MDWDNEKSLELIELYKMKPEIWQATNKFYYNKLKKQDAWSEIAKNMGTTVDIVKNKLNSLLSSFRREKAKHESSMKTGSGRDEVYQSKWFGYDAFQFLMEKSKCRKTLNTVKSNLDEEAVKSEHTTNQTLSRETVAQHPKCVSNIKKRKLEATSDPRIDQAFTILQKSTERDACEIYGEHVAMKLRSYSKRTQIMVQHLFNNILFNADMGQYDNINANYNDANPFPRSTVSSPYPSPYSNISSTKSHSRTSTPFSPAPSPIPVVHHNINVNSNDSYQRSTVAPPYPPPYSNLSSNQSHHSRTSTPLSQPTSPIPVVHHKINTNYDDTDPHQLSIAISTVTSPDPSPNSGVLSTKSCPTPLSQPLTSVSVVHAIENNQILPSAAANYIETFNPQDSFISHI
nr:unnamed protein product [Callosobruchus analis]